MVLDVEKFHRRTPICPAHKKWYVMQGRTGLFYLQHCCPFGAVGSEGNSGSVAGAIIDIWKAHKIGPSAKWSDDVSSLRSPISGTGTEDDPFTYAYDREQAIAISAPTGIPWHPEKGQDFADSFVYVGLEWNIDSRTVALSEKKRLKFTYRIDTFYAHVKSGGKVNEEQVMKIHGSLCHIAFVYSLGRSRLSSFSSFIAAFHKYKNPRIKLHPPPSLITDAGWWVQQLLVAGFTRSLLPYGDLQDLGISVDASTDWGIGIAWNDGWDAWEVRDGWKGPWRDIGWLECLALELLVLHLEARSFHNCRIRVRSDNQGIIGSYYYKGRS
ncbi:hypothetical protein EST38_g12167 [Candolleomyces aberdarensis]|uniref:Uncharacterized protein n=1 Tax=Candolleomyces aberdarensis TaxID=2316362 RepID=A0A4Q2D340_9AGAR|nr:hypothetical protein EST38_g12167 [Candolleomyces aberdarensis]